MQPNKSFAVIIFSAIISLAALAQEPVKEKCPTISVHTPDFTVEEGATVTFTANLSGWDKEVTFNWSVSTGSISAGSATTSITIDTRGLGGQYLTATVEAAGLPASCNAYSSGTISINMPKPQPRSFYKEEFSTTSAFNSVMDRFAKSVDSTSPDPFATRVLILYPGKDAKAAANVKQMEQLARSSFKKEGVGESWFQVLTGGRREKTLYEMFIVPTGALAPMPDPLP